MSNIYSLNKVSTVHCPRKCSTHQPYAICHCLRPNSKRPSTCRVPEKRLSLPWSQSAVPKSHRTHPPFGPGIPTTVCAWRSLESSRQRCAGVGEVTRASLRPSPPPRNRLATGARSVVASPTIGPSSTLLSAPTYPCRPGTTAHAISSLYAAYHTFSNYT